MTNKQQKEWYEHDKAIIKKRLGLTEENFEKFRRVGMKLQEIYENDCNGLYADEDQYQNVVTPWYELGDKLAKELELHIFYQTDPRGATIYLNTELTPENNYTKVHCIY